MARNMDYVPAPFQRRGDANAGRGAGRGPGVPIVSKVTKAPPVDPPGGTHIGTQMPGSK